MYVTLVDDETNSRLTDYANYCTCLFFWVSCIDVINDVRATVELTLKKILLLRVRGGA